MTPRNLLLTLAYEGTHFLGWQKTSMGRSVEEELERVLEQILQHPVSLQAASRTDAGVHAMDQKVNLITTKAPSDLTRLKKSLNALLPKDMAVLEVEEVPLSFHPTLHTEGKEYRYLVQRGVVNDPLDRHRRWHFPYPLNLTLMRQACPLFLGAQDFATFCNQKKGRGYEDHIRELSLCEVVEESPDKLMIRLVGSHFLYRMARNIAGTLLYVGCGKLEIEALPAIFQARDRRLAGVTAPAHGLTLHRVFYAAREPFQEHHEQSA